MASTSLSSFFAVDIRTIKQGDIVIFRTASIGHRNNLVLRHGRTAKVTGFARNRTGAQQITVCFLADPRLDDAQGNLSAPISLSGNNLVPYDGKDGKNTKAALAAHNEVERVWAAASEKHGPQVAQAIAVRQIQLTLLNEGAFDSLDNQVTATATSNEDMPF